MRNKLLLLTTILICNFQLNAQQCDPGTGLDYLFGNQIKATVGTSGDLFWDGSDGQFFVPTEYGGTALSPTSIFAAGLWLGGFDGANNLKMAAQTYRQGGNDFWPSPIDEATGDVFENDCAQFDRFWRVPGYAVAQHLADLQDGTIDQNIDPHLKEWPAKGNPFFQGIFGFDLPDQELAPFHDYNTDGSYNPEDGDYPVIDTAWPDVVAADLLWTVFNDKGNIHSETQGEQLGVEVQLTAYSFDCAADSILDRSVFIRHKIINRNSSPLFEFYLGLFTDLDLGCWDDDFIGSAPDQNSFFAYNSTNDDSDCADFAGGIVKGYGPNPPVQSVTFLNTDMAAFAFYNNDGTPQGNPNAAGDYYNYLKGNWRDGLPMEYGGDGYNEATFPTPFMFPSDPNSPDPNAWSEVSENNTGDDRRGVGSTGPFEIAGGQSITVDAVYAFHWDTLRTNLGNVSFMYDNVERLQEIYDNNFAITSQCYTPNCIVDCVWPGDTDADGIVSYLDLLNIGVANAATGTTRSGISWSPYTVTDWSNSFPSLNYKHGDCDGNGMANEADVAILDLNYGQVNSKYTGMVGSNNTSDQLTIETIQQIPAVGQDTVCPGTNVVMKVSAGLFSAVDNVHGLGFNIGQDENLAQLFDATFYVGIAGLDDDETAISYYHNTSTDLFRTRVEASATRLDGSERSLNGDLFYYRIKVADDIFDYLDPNDPYLHITIENIRAVRADGSEVFLGSQTYSMYVKNPETGTRDIQGPKLTIMPNPASDLVQVILEQGRAEEVLLHDGVGRLVFSNNEESADFRIETKNLPAGIYYLSVKSNKGWTREKICIMH